MDKYKNLEAIAKEIESCKICKSGKIGKPVPGEGNPDAKIVFIGEAPGKTESLTGRPFVGRSGQLLRSQIREIGLKEDEVYITSPVKYLPKGTPTLLDIAHGKLHLEKQLKIINPKVLVLLGSVAAQAVLGEKIPIMKMHGKTIEKQNKSYFISLHPAAVLRVPTLRPLFLEDFKKIKSKVRVK